MKSAFLTSSALVLAAVVNRADAHGRLISPPHRGYIGKLPQFAGVIPPNYSDNGLNAGGIAQTSGGKHGVCGDPYSGVREHETGGIYGTFPTNGAKAIGACYAPGATVDVQVQLTANHKGYFEFQLCKLNGKHDKETEECFQTLAQPSGEKQWQVPTGNEVFTIKSVLPTGVTCEGDSHCVLRWYYVGWNNPGVGVDGQEQFWNCADVFISNTCGAALSPSSSSPTTQAPTPSSATPTYAPATSSTIPTYAPVPSSSKPSPSSSVPTPKPTSNGSCGACNNCYYPGTNACFIGWSAAQCAQVPEYKWCGGAPPSTDVCGTCSNCYYPGTNSCFIGWSAAQCAQVPVFKWCDSYSPSPSSNAPTTYPTQAPSAAPTTQPATQAPTYAPAPSTPSPSSPSVLNTVSWNWFMSSTTDCDASLSKDTLNRGLYIGGENIPADCGKTATFTYNGHTVTATYAWRTTGGNKYHELSPQAFAKLLGSDVDVATISSATQMQQAINDPGHVNAQCTGTC